MNGYCSRKVFFCFAFSRTAFQKVETVEKNFSKNMIKPSNYIPCFKSAFTTWEYCTNTTVSDVIKFLLHKRNQLSENTT